MNHTFKGKPAVALPVNLVVANKMHDGVGALLNAEHAQRQLQEVFLSTSDARPSNRGIPDHIITEFHANMARGILCAIAHQCSIEQVFSALAAVQAPASMSDIREGLQAVRDTQKAGA